MAAGRASSRVILYARYNDYDSAAKPVLVWLEAQGVQFRTNTTVTDIETTDRDDWDKATRAQRHLAVAADAELRRRHPAQHYSPLRSAEAEPATKDQREELTP